MQCASNVVCTVRINSCTVSLSSGSHEAPFMRHCSLWGNKTPTAAAFLFMLSYTNEALADRSQVVTASYDSNHCNLLRNDECIAQYLLKMRGVLTILPHYMWLNLTVRWIHYMSLLVMIWLNTCQSSWARGDRAGRTKRLVLIATQIEKHCSLKNELLCGGLRSLCGSVIVSHVITSPSITCLREVWREKGIKL